MWCAEDDVPRLARHALAAPVLALKCINDQVLVVGRASVLQFVSLVTGRVLRESVLFPGGAVHGIQWFDEGLLIVFGQRDVALVRVDTGLVEHRLAAPDWIHDCLAVPGDDEAAGRHIAIITAHNTVLLWRPDSPSPVRTVSCTIRSILYGARFYLRDGQPLSALVVACGTVFNKVLLWFPFASSNTHASPVAVTATLSGHAGVIFNCSFSQDGRTLMTVSDDRSCRVWHLPELPWTRGESETDVHEGVTLWGHSSRLWDATLVDNDTRIVTVGEDSTVRLWSVETGASLRVMRGHEGKDIRALTLTQDGRAIVTGAYDCAVRVWSLDDTNGDAEDDDNTAAGAAVEEGAQQFEQGEGETAYPVPDQTDNPRTAAMTVHGVLVVITRLGRVLVRVHPRDAEWTQVAESAALLGYVSSAETLSEDESKLWVAYGSLSGTVLALSVDARTGQLVDLPREWTVVEGVRVLTLSFCSHGRYVGVTGDPGSLLYLTEVPPLGGQSPTIHRLATPGGFVQSSCLLETPITHQNQQQQQYLRAFVAGDRRGNLHLFNIDAPATGSKPLSPVFTLPRVHVGQGATFLVALRDGATLISAGRDGMICWVRLDTQDPLAWQLHVTARRKFARGVDWVNRIIVVKGGSHDEGTTAGGSAVGGQDESESDVVIATGFRSPQLVCWNVSRPMHIFTVPCGGGHRSVSVGVGSIMPLSGRPMCWSMTYIHQQHVNVRDWVADAPEQEALMQPRVAPVVSPTTTKILHDAYHGQKSNCVVAVGDDALLTSGEDCRVNMFRVRRSSATDAVASGIGAECALERVHRQDSHETGVRCITAVRDTSSSSSADAAWLVFSAGGKQQVFVWRVCPSTDNEMMRWAKCPAWLVHNPDVDTRVMSLSAHPTASPHRWLLAVGTSDTLLRLLGFDSHTRTFSLLALARDHSRCLTASSFALEPDCLVLLTAATSGRLVAHSVAAHATAFAHTPPVVAGATKPTQPDESTVARLALTMEPVTVHQNGVNDLAVCTHSPGTVFVASAGDDGAVAVLLLRASSTHPAETHVVRRWLNTAAHSSLAMAVCFLPGRDISLCSVGMDQRLSRWALAGQSHDTEEESLSSLVLRESHLVDVADVSGMAVSESGALLAISGVGLHLFRVVM